MGRKVWRRLGTAHDPKHTASSVKHGGAVWWHGHAWLPVALGYWCSVIRPKQPDEFWSVQGYTLCPDSVTNGAKLIGRRFIVQMDNDPNHTAKATQEFLMVKKVEYFAMAMSISWSQPDWAAFHSLKTKLKAERPTNKQQLKSAAGKWKWRDMWPSMVTHTRNLCSAFNPSKVHTHSSEHTHTVNTHTEQWAAIYAVAPGEQLGVWCLAQVHLRGWREHWTFTAPTYNSCRTWDSNSQPLDYESDSLTIRPRLPQKGLAKHHKGGNPVSGDVHEFQT